MLSVSQSLCLSVSSVPDDGSDAEDKHTQGETKTVNFGYHLELITCVLSMRLQCSVNAVLTTIQHHRRQHQHTSVLPGDQLSAFSVPLLGGSALSLPHCLSCYSPRQRRLQR